MTTDELIAALEPQIQPVKPDDSMAEAGRKALLPEFVKMLRHESGSRTGEDIEDVHDMRVSIRRIRSTLRLLSDYYKPKAVDPYNRQLRRVGRTLGAVRDLDVMIDNLEGYARDLPEARRAAMQPVFTKLSDERATARHDLNRLLDKGSYRRFTADFAAFLTTENAGARSLDGDHLPTQVRHLLPALIYDHVGHVRAYDGVIAEADATTLHALRIEFKRLRYAVSLFSEIMGGTIKNFVDELKAMQDHLGSLNDVATAQARLTDLIARLDPDDAAPAIEALRDYMTHLDSKGAALRTATPALWTRFNGKTVQKHLASAIAAL
jgi:CHAD domain-containing protein